MDPVEERTLHRLQNRVATISMVRFSNSSATNLSMPMISFGTEPASRVPSLIYADLRGRLL